MAGNGFSADPDALLSQVVAFRDLGNDVSGETSRMEDELDVLWRGFGTDQSARNIVSQLADAKANLFNGGRELGEALRSIGDFLAASAKAAQQTEFGNSGG